MTSRKHSTDSVNLKARDSVFEQNNACYIVSASSKSYQRFNLGPPHIAYKVPSVKQAMLVSPLPMIEISLAPPEEPQSKPYSPFTPTMKASFANDIHIHDSADDDGMEPYRPTILSSPPTAGARPWGSPAAPMRKPAQAGAGLADAEIQVLLRAAREQRPVGKKQDLRREVALKAHKSKQGTVCFIFLAWALTAHAIVVIII